MIFISIDNKEYMKIIFKYNTNYLFLLEKFFKEKKKKKKL